MIMPNPILIKIDHVRAIRSDYNEYHIMPVIHRDLILCNQRLSR